MTGAREALGRGIEEKVRLAQSLGDMPVCVGFGVATPEHAREIGGYADGVVVGSAIVDTIEAATRGRSGGASARASAVEAIGRFIEALKAPLRR